MKYSDKVAEWLVELGYTDCFFVGGGNIMHLIESISRVIRCHAVIHEVAAGIAAEYFNESSTSAKAFALVTAGPGLTNIVTALAGAFLESRELLVLGGQAKTADLARGEVRQRGIQEVDGVAVARPLSVVAELLEQPVGPERFAELVHRGASGRKGPVFLEMPLDVQARDVDFGPMPARPRVGAGSLPAAAPAASPADLADLIARVRQARRPVLLLGGGVSRAAAQQAAPFFERMGLPIATTWNGADRIAADHPLYVGRPNTWGQRSANLVIQQADLLVALGSRLGLQQTGFNWQSFVPVGQVVQVDIDPTELRKGHPHVDLALQADADSVLAALAAADLGDHQEWVEYARGVRRAVPLIEPVNTTGGGYFSPYAFVDRLSALSRGDDVIIPCSSGGAFTVMMQVFQQKAGQVIVTNKGLASMGYGLSGAIGAAFAHPGQRVILVEGDGGFAQNLQEVGTAAINRLNLKMFVFDDSGYASIRMTQRSYFGGRYVGCDRNTGLGLPDWEKLFPVWGVPVMRLRPGDEDTPRFRELFDGEGPAAFVVSIDPEQTYFPKIASRVTASGAMESNPLHRMSPDLEPELQQRIGRYLPR